MVVMYSIKSSKKQLNKHLASVRQIEYSNPASNRDLVLVVVMAFLTPVFSLSYINSTIVHLYYMLSLPLPANIGWREGGVGGEEPSTLLSFFL